MIFPHGGYFLGIWKRGKNICKKYYFSDNLKYKENDWSYCEEKDRRFNIERENEIKAYGISALKNSEQNVLKIPSGCYGNILIFFI